MSNAKWSSKKWSHSAILLGTATIFSVAFQNCGVKSGDSSSQPSVSTQSTSIGSGSSITGATVAPGKVTFSLPAAQKANLGTQLKIPVTITADAKFSGALNLSVVTPELKLLDPGAGITFALDSSSLTLSPGGKATVNVTVKVSTLSPSFSASVFHIKAVDSAHATNTFDLSVPLQVMAVYDASVNHMTAQAVPESWSTAPGSVTKFISHPEGVTVRFNNMDSAVHLVHSSGGPIAHQDRANGMRASPDNGVTVGGTYQVVIPAGTAVVTSQVYCHLHENSNDNRSFQFNVAVVPVVTATPAPNAMATFANINTNTLSKKCVGCHSAASPAGGVNLSTYAGVLKAVVKNDASTSALALAVQLPNPSMPLNAAALSAAEVKNIQDWINLGALNN